MSFLAPLYALGALAILGPILFHLVRKRPSEIYEFSSLLFLDAAPAKLTARSHIEHWFLLLCRIGLIGLIAFAFARPYWNRATEQPSIGDRGLNRLLLVDASASMQREGVWDAALQAGRTWIAGAGPNDTIAVYQFSNALQPMVSVHDSMSVPMGTRASRAVQALESIRPNQGAGNIGSALASALDAIQIDPATGGRRDAIEIGLISDMATGNSLDGLVGVDWPENAVLKLIPVQPKRKGNAFATLLSKDQDELHVDGDRNEGDPLQRPSNRDSSSQPDSGRSSAVRDDRCRIRVTNEAGSIQEALELMWLDERLQPISDSKTAVRVPAGMSRVAIMPAPPSNARSLELRGDGCEFDNRRFFYQPVPRNLQTVCIESPVDPPEQSLWYFVQQVPLDDPSTRVTWARWDPAEVPDKPIDPKEIPWVISGHELGAREIEMLGEYMNSGGHVLSVLDIEANARDATGRDWGARCAEMLQAWSKQEVAALREATVKPYGLWTSVDLKAPIFSPFADSKFNDFSKIRFWKHRVLTLEEDAGWAVAAKFDSGDPAILSRSIGDGSLTVATAGWQPRESQWALSSKFVPMISQWFAVALPKTAMEMSWEAGDVIGDNSIRQLTWSAGGPEQRVPDAEGDRWSLSNCGIYQATMVDRSIRTFAINVPIQESATQPIDPIEFSRLGVRLEPPEKPPVSPDAMRQMQATELESRQSTWWWLLAVALIVVLLESIVCLRRPGLVPSN
ncbi:MAG: BatA domain-containing protein [Pirellula sp.]